MEQGIQMGVVEWNIPGIGEPMMRGDLILDLCRKVKATGNDTSMELSSNGTMFSEDHIEGFVKAGLDRIHVSLDSPKADIHDMLRDSPGAFESVIFMLDRFNMVKKTLKKKKPVINIDMVLTSKNYDSLPDMVRLCKKYDLEYISINPLRVDTGNQETIESKGLRLDSIMTKRFFHDYEKLILKNELQINLNGYGDTEHGIVSESAEGFDSMSVDLPEKNISVATSPCFEPWTTMSINYLGDVGFCTSCGHWDDAPNIRGKKLKDIWFGQKFNEVRRRILENKPYGICFHCGVKEVRKSISHYLKKDGN